MGNVQLRRIFNLSTGLFANLVILAGCEVKQEVNEETQSYSFELNGCATGEHSFSSLTDICAALKDEAVNKGCARSMRRDFFSSKGCAGSFDPPAEKTTDATPQGASPNQAGPSPTAEASPQEIAARNSFAKTFASGSKKISFTDVEASVTAKSASGGALTTYPKCSTIIPMTVSGEYPTLTYKWGLVECKEGTSDATPKAWASFQLHADQLTYKAAAIPASTDPNQFRLVLTSVRAPAYPTLNRLKSRDSLNALMRDTTVFMDLIEDFEGPMGWPEVGHSYFSIALDRPSSAGGRATMRLNFDVTNVDRSEESLEINAAVQLQ